jgi:hypothetical protein
LTAILIEAFRSETETSDKSTEVSGKTNETIESVSTHRSFVFGKIYKSKTKLRDFHRNISVIGR